MTDANAAIEWYIARDGQQHGPLSEAEMRTFIDLGHLRDQDLVWRSGFPDWRPAPDVFAVLRRPSPLRAAAQQVTPRLTDAYVGQQQAELQQRHQGYADPRNAPQQSAPQRDGRGAAVAGPAHQATYQPSGSAPRSDLRSPDQLLGEQARGGNASGYGAPVRSNTNQAARIGGTQRATVSQPAVGLDPGRPASMRPGQRASDPIAARPDDLDDFDDGDDAPPAKRGSGRRTLAAALIIVVLGGAAATAYLERDRLSALAPAITQFTGKSAGPSAVATPILAGASSPEAVDATFQRAPIWRHIKQEYPDWYTERVTETVKLAGEKQGDTAIAKHLAEALVALRRKHADQALTASPERLRFVAGAFLDNLQALSKVNVETCYGFISQGETYPGILEMLQKPSTSEPLQKQVVAVFEAISDGRKSPQSYLPPRKADYDALAVALTARGWSQTDLQTFSDPRALGRASPQQVCRMVQDWFAAQISIEDPAAQLRLLVESLRPVVAG